MRRRSEKKTKKEEKRTNGKHFTESASEIPYFLRGLFYEELFYSYQKTRNGLKRTIIIVVKSKIHIFTKKWCCNL